MKIKVPHYVSIPFFIILLSFSSKSKKMYPYVNGNTNGSPPVDIRHFDGIFRIFRIKSDFNSITKPFELKQDSINLQNSNLSRDSLIKYNLNLDSNFKIFSSHSNINATYEKWRYSASFFQNTGDTAHPIFTGSLFINDSNLLYDSQKGKYVAPFSGNFNLPNFAWNLAGSGNYPSFNFNLARGMSTFDNILNVPDTIHAGDSLSPALLNLQNTDSIFIIVSDYNRNRVQKKSTGMDPDISFSSSELGPLQTNGCMINIFSMNVSTISINGYNYLLFSTTIYTKIINKPGATSSN